MSSTFMKIWLWLLLFYSGWPGVSYAQHSNPPEVVIPLKLTSLGGNSSHPFWFSYSLHFGGHRYIVHMKIKKFFISRHFSVFSYTDQGAVFADEPFVPSNCYYHGYVQGDPDSLVVLSTCLGGFQGTLKINNMLYEIKPKRLSTTFEHLVYKVESEETHSPTMRCALTEEIARQLKSQDSDKFVQRQSDYKGWWTHRNFLELVLVVDNQRFIHRGSNTSNVIQEVFTIMNEVNSLLFSLDVDAVLLGLEIWNKNNFVSRKEIHDLLLDFCLWKRKSLDSRIKNDIVHLFIQQYFGITVGLAYVGTVCNANYNCGVDQVVGEDLHRIGHIVAHEIGHNFGMEHDDKDVCICGMKNCIMAPIENESTQFSNCSYSALMKTTSSTNCMRMPPNPLHIYKNELCGNSVIDAGEQCDCGSLKRCADDACCLANCTLKSGAACASGLCCKDCHIMPSGTMCRAKQNECDLPEWCNGISQQCPEDVFLLGGTPCLSTGLCYQKRCNNRDEQCRQIFGEQARNAQEKCYMEVNTRGDRFGNCGLTSNDYIKCPISDSLCGRLQCENISQIPSLEDHSNVHWTHFNEVTCWGTDYHWGMTKQDTGYVKDGTECGLMHMCHNKRCTIKPFWSTVCSSRKCNMKGVCNNKHHCHCNMGWGPPNCLIQGFGGSIDSGPPPRGHIKFVEEKVPMMAEGEGLEPMRSTVRQLWLAVLTLPFCLAQDWASSTPPPPPPEVLIARKINDNWGGLRSPAWLSYSLHFGNKRHIVHIKAKQFLVSAPFSVFTYTEQGALLEDQPFVQNDCYYQGYVEGDPESLRNSLNVRIKSDVGHLLIQQKFDGNLGKAYIRTVYNSVFNCGVNRILGENLYHVGHSVAHEIGHNLGMFHDKPGCTCGLKLCIMAPEDNFSKTFSNCSYAKFIETIAKTDCMRLPPSPLHTYKYEFCGDGVIDDGEECDCGSLKLCEQEPCCLANCTLKSGAECASGLCCEDGHIMPSGTVCREKENACDLPERCIRTSQQGPEDMYLVDGSACTGTSYCYENKCNNRDEQCQKIFW
ncbi:disintegrin and metalloproteinase domain-containing protein 25-like [Perognathus longimembris pacificus]|uniref:disintegrin and metalloproteinase domain-containing protein 25-like n=1 Tax=Perognathus longimembris pacificus TaxID=214514 RepID=UPI002019EB0C|nr:disintegrin and metalloproteinase domain-containing protein 25-like [Perognathus longimembris pacificus]